MNPLYGGILASLLALNRGALAFAYSAIHETPKTIGGAQRACRARSESGNHRLLSRRVLRAVIRSCRGAT